MSNLELLQFNFSNFNEKARWTLDYKRVPHSRTTLLPGPHGMKVKPLTGNTRLPVLRVSDQIIAGSATIIDHLERQFPEMALYPEDPEQRKEALEIQSWFDDQIGPHARCAFFYDLLPDAGYAASCFTQRQPPFTRLLYRLFFPISRIVMRSTMKINASSAELGRRTTKEGLDFIAQRAGQTGYLVGDKFTVADLTAASLLQLTAFPPEMQPNLPEPRSKGVSRWLARWHDHPGTRWIEEMYRRHRGVSAEIMGARGASPSA